MVSGCPSVCVQNNAQCASSQKASWWCEVPFSSIFLFVFVFWLQRGRKRLTHASLSLTAHAAMGDKSMLDVSAAITRQAVSLMGSAACGYSLRLQSVYFQSSLILFSFFTSGCSNKGGGYAYELVA